MIQFLKYNSRKKLIIHLFFIIFRLNMLIFISIFIQLFSNNRFYKSDNILILKIFEQIYSNTISK